MLEGSRYRDDGLDGAGGADMLSGLAGNDTLTGGRGADSLFGGEGDDTLQGNDGSDNMRGEAGNDLIEGNKGTDRIRGGSGEDTLDGGRSSDTLTGGADADTFILRQTSGSDHITDFTDDLDVLLLDSGLWAGTLTAQEVVDQFGTLRDGDVVLDFGSDEFVLRSVTDQNVLVDDIQIF